MENGLVFEVGQWEIQFWLFEILHHHLMIIFGYCIMDWQVTIVVFGIQLGPDVLHNTSLAF